MNTPAIITTQLNCKVSDLTIRAIHKPSRADVELTDPVELSLKLTFSDNVNGHLVHMLMPLGLNIWVSFYAKPYSPESEIQLGDVTLQTLADVFSYQPKLQLEGGLAAMGLSSEQIYQIEAIARVGNSPFPMPTLIRGYLGGLTLPSGAQFPIEAIHPVAATKKPTSSRRKAQKPSPD
jgi:hypothetical protein